MIFLLIPRTPDREQQKAGGYVAEFCPICREITPFRLYRYGIGKFIQVPVGMTGMEGSGCHFRGMCRNCRTTIELDGMDYLAELPKPPKETGDLIEKTFPAILTARAEQLAWRERLLSPGLTPRERRAVLLEPFKILFRQAEELARGVHLNLASIIVAIVAVIAVIVLAIMDIASSGWTGALLGAALVLVIAFACLEPRRLFRKRVLPALVKGLAPLDPDESELADCLARLRRADYAIGRRVRQETLWERLQKGKPARPAAPEASEPEPEPVTSEPALAPPPPTAGAEPES